jgi:hypothetical protein
MTRFSRSMQPLLIGSVVLLSIACRQDSSSNPSDTTGSESATGSQYSTPPSTTDQRPIAPELGRSQVDRDQMNRDDMSGTQRMEERMPVAGRDEAIELGNGGSGGSNGMGGSSGSHH